MCILNPTYILSKEVLYLLVSTGLKFGIEQSQRSSYISWCV